MRRRRVALALLVVGALCLPAPLYLGWAAQAASPPPKTSQVYRAQPLDPANASDRAAIVDRHAAAVAISVHQVSEQYSAGEYRAPEEARRTLEAAMETGSASTDDPDARADLRAIARNDTFVYDAYGDDDRYYRLRVRDRGGGVRAEPVSTDRVANATVERAAFEYGDLTPGERETVDRIVERSDGEDEYGYRPRVNDPFVDELPALVEKDGTLYSLWSNVHSDGPGQEFAGFVVGLVVAGVGVVLLLFGGGLFALGWWRERGASG